jgi:hypothetical protein
VIADAGADFDRGLVDIRFDVFLLESVCGSQVLVLFCEAEAGHTTAFA